MAISLNKIKNRKPSQPKTTEEILAEQYRYYFYHNPNRTEYVNKYDDTIQGECMVLDVSSANPEASGDEKNLTTLPNSGIEVGMILNLKFAEGKETWVVTNKEHLAVKSHDKYKISPLHHEGILIKSDFTEEVIDIKMTNSNSKPEVKHMYYSPISRVHCGDYILIDGLYYLVQDIQNNLDLPYCVAVECNQKLTAKVWDREIPCRIENSSYGSKGEVTNYSQISDFDSRANIQVQVNKYTKMLYEGFRQIFNNSKSDIYEITKVQSVFGVSAYREGGYFNNICKFCKYVVEDDFENGIAYNYRFEKQESVDTPVIYILGEDEIPVNTDFTFTIINTNNVVFSLDQDTINENNATILSQDGKNCTVEMLTKDVYVQLLAHDANGDLVAQYTFYITRR